MTDEELRRLVRDAIARHLGRGESEPGPGAGGPGGPGGQAVRRAHDPRPDLLRPDPPWRAHSSFGRFLVMAGDEQGGSCLIEPAVECNHCGFCQSYGH